MADDAAQMCKMACTFVPILQKAQNKGYRTLKDDNKTPDVRTSRAWDRDLHVKTDLDQFLEEARHNRRRENDRGEWEEERDIGTST